MIWFLCGQALWQAPLLGTGEKLRLGAPKRVAPVTYQTGRWLTLATTSDGHWLAVDDGSGYDSDHPGGLWLIETHPYVTVRKLARTVAPSFAPDNQQLAVARVKEGSDDTSIAILNLVTNRWRMLSPKADQPFWSADGREIAFLRESPDGDTGVVVDARNGQLRFQTRTIVRLAEPILSPDGRFYAELCAISRPKLGHTIHDRRTGKIIERSFDWPGRLPTELYGWSPDGKWLACNWRVPDPDNDGAWLRDEVGLVSWKPGTYRWIDVGKRATFSPDSKHLFWLRSTGTLCTTTVGPKAAPIQKLLTHVEVFAVP